ncbi:hypothetical protein HYE67_010251 [Fusarium culmorum]|uniref:Zn(2)-C6 fungal-type domain-containing protein n=1 Tax=Fusarium culmorum TaxID=5516 RepID=A0A2T4H617_FUSCU|nr:hypothetical protein FCULG_00011279 [Fusarium culmorum]QPC68020.1 hypothetical protein HYE67_010251 [Fusarium culmorum]
MSSPTPHEDQLPALSPTSTNASLPALSPTSTNTSSADHEQQRNTPSKRILSCILCQQRKKKCDKKTPCSNCTRLGAVCTPSKPATPRKRRRPNQELLERLSRCEELLRHCTCARLPTPESVLNRFQQSPVHSEEKKSLGQEMSSKETN